MKHDFCGGKYTVIFNEGTGALSALRYGEPWRDLTGDKLVLSMLQAADTQRKLLGRACVLLEQIKPMLFECPGLGAQPTAEAVERLIRDILNDVEDQNGG